MNNLDSDVIRFESSHPLSYFIGKQNKNDKKVNQINT